METSRWEKTECNLHILVSCFGKIFMKRKMFNNLRAHLYYTIYIWQLFWSLYLCFIITICKPNIYSMHSINQNWSTHWPILKSTLEQSPTKFCLGKVEPKQIGCFSRDDFFQCRVFTTKGIQNQCPLKFAFVRYS